MGLILTITLMGVHPVKAATMINEIFADPPAGLSGDANNDGTRSVSDDEFIEFFNNTAGAADASGWSVSDNVSLRHLFPSGSVIAPYSFLVLFGGGAPSLPGVNWQTASTGSLSLNNGGDTVSLLDSSAVVIHQVIYGNIGGKDQAVTLFPDGQGAEFVLHSELETAQGRLFSPGTSVDSKISLVPFEEEEPVGDVGEPIGNPEESTGGVGEPEDNAEGPGNATVPELPVLVYFAIGLGPLLLKKQRANRLLLGDVQPFRKS
jgi:hypothetical protein